MCSVEHNRNFFCRLRQDTAANVLYRDQGVKSGRLILVEHLQRLMKAKGWLRPNRELDIAKLHEKVKGSKRRLYRVLRGEVNFSIDYYERILQKGFGQTLDSILTGLQISTVPQDPDIEDLQEQLRDAILNAKQTKTLDGLRHGLRALFETAAADKALQEKARPPSPPSRVGQDADVGTSATSQKTKKNRVQ